MKILTFFLIFTLASPIKANEESLEPTDKTSILEKKSNRTRIVKASILVTSCIVGFCLLQLDKEVYVKSFMNALGLAGFSMTAYDFIFDDEADIKKTNNLLKESKSLIKDFKPAKT